jgi:hypothetical protein
VDGAAAVVGARTADGQVHVLFNVEGHQVVAIAAMMDLEQASADAHTRVNELLATAGRTLGEAAVFPDTIRDDRPETAAFHFVNLFFRDGDQASPPFPPGPSVVTEIATFDATLRDLQATVTERVDALSWVIHLCGDIHQPMHCASRKSDLHPDGDRGGNRFRLRGGSRNLHSLWDSAVDVVGGQSEEQVAASILQEHPRSSFAQELRVTDRKEWALASHRTAREKAYALVENAQRPPTPSTSYITAMHAIGRRQAALAAYRLADLLAGAFGGR